MTSSSVAPAWARKVVRARAAPWCILAVVLALVPLSANGQGLPSPCVGAIRQAEMAARIPPGLLTAIGLVESGRPGPGGRIEPWPWTINVAGVGAQFETKEAAIAAVQVAWRLGVRSIDVGCMQVNLLHHPEAFATLDDAFDPARNASYAAGFLQRLFGQSRSWGDATAAYHSQTPERGDAYRQKVAAWWPGAGLQPPASAKAGVAAIDPRGVYTPEFRARLAQDAVDHLRLIAPQRGSGWASRGSMLAISARRTQFAQANPAGLMR